MRDWVDGGGKSYAGHPARGTLTSVEGGIMMSLLESRSRVVERVQMESRLEKLQETMAATELPPAVRKQSNSRRRN